MSFLFVCWKQAAVSYRLPKYPLIYTAARVEVEILVIDAAAVKGIVVVAVAVGGGGDGVHAG